MWLLLTQGKLIYFGFSGFPLSFSLQWWLNLVGWVRNTVLGKTPTCSHWQHLKCSSSGWAPHMLISPYEHLGLSASLSILLGNSPFCSPLRNCLAEILAEFLDASFFSYKSACLFNYTSKIILQMHLLLHTFPITTCWRSSRGYNHWLTCELDPCYWRPLSSSPLLGMYLHPLFLP